MSLPLSLRLAFPNDLPRLSHIAIASYAHPPHFIYERPNQHLYPEDTIAYYTRFLGAAMKRADYCVVVVEAVLRGLGEERKGEWRAVVPSNVGDEGVHRGGMEVDGEKLYGEGQEGRVGVVGWIVVGLRMSKRKREICWEIVESLRHSEGIKERNGTSNANRDEAHGETADHSEGELPRGPGRDHDIIRHERLTALYKSLYHHLPFETLTIEYLAIHPTYWRRGHALSLCSFVTALSRASQCPAIVFSNEDAEAMYRAVGFKRVELVLLEKDEVEKEGGFWYGPGTGEEGWRRELGVVVMRFEGVDA